MLALTAGTNIKWVTKMFTLDQWTTPDSLKVKVPYGNLNPVQWVYCDFRNAHPQIALNTHCKYEVAPTICHKFNWQHKEIEEDKP